MLTPFLAAVALLTRIPVRRPFSPIEVSTATPLFPLIGALIGLAQLLLAQLLTPFLPALLLSACLVAAASCVTGALHLDGLADVADGLGSGGSREEMLRIMRDPAIGTYGAVALVLMLIVRASALGTLIERREADSFLVLAPTLGRWATVALGHALPYARPEGGLGSVAAGVSRGQLALATLVAAVVTVVAGTLRAIACWLVVLGVTITFGRVCARRLGGFTGDVLGANNELSEAAVLVTAVVLTR